MMTQLNSSPQLNSEDPDYDYSAFLLRIWQQSADGWQASLEDIHTGAKQEFSTLDQLLSKLTKQIAPK